MAGIAMVFGETGKAPGDVGTEASRHDGLTHTGHAPSVAHADPDGVIEALEQNMLRQLHERIANGAVGRVTG